MSIFDDLGNLVGDIGRGHFAAYNLFGGDVQSASLGPSNNQVIACGDCRWYAECTDAPGVGMRFRGVSWTEHTNNTDVIHWEFHYQGQVTKFDSTGMKEKLMYPFDFVVPAVDVRYTTIKSSG
jgi:hypothetical protein